MSATKPPKLCLIDASGYIHRAYHALPPLTTSKGEPVNAVYGFLRMVTKIVKSERPDLIAVCYDTPELTFRHKSYEAYKATRVETEEALLVQLPVVEELVMALGLPSLKKAGFEADDLIATTAKWGRRSGYEVLILSGDKDVLQLVDEHVHMRDEIRKVEYDAVKVLARYGVNPGQLVDYFSLMGDKVDNVSGVPGVGEKTASKFISEHGSLEGLYDNLDTLKASLKEKLLENKGRVFENRNLIRLDDAVPLDLSEETLKPRSPDSAVLNDLMKRLEFRGELPGGESAHGPAGDSNTRRVVHVVLIPSELAVLTTQLAAATLVGYDTETTSVDCLSCDLVGVALATQEQEAWYIPVGHVGLNVPQQLAWSQIRDALQPVFSNPAVVKVGQNIKFDNTVLKRMGLNIEGPFYDTMVAAYCIDPGRSGYGLKEMASEFLGERMVQFEEVAGKSKSANIAESPVDRAASYAAADAEVVLRLKTQFDESLRNSGMESLFNDLEMPLVGVLEDMEKAGIRLDVSHLKVVREEFEGKKRILEKEIFELAGETFLLNSPQQLSRILFEKLKLPSAKRTKTGFSTNEDVLRRLAGKHPICEKIIDYRELAKLSSTYVDSLLALVDPVTARVHTSFHQTGTATGRLSSSDPNLQNIPIRSELGRLIRRAFVASPGCVLVSADYSQIDLRSLAHMSRDPVLTETFKRGGDVHTATAAEMFHLEPGQVTTEMRRRAKAINFGIVYGQQAWGLSQSLDIPVEEAQEFIDRYFERYAGVKNWIEATLAQARRSGFVSTWAGRKRMVREINSENSHVRGFAERIAVNTPLQGTSADIIKKAMIRAHSDIQNKKLKTRMLLQVHDELLFDVPSDELAVALPLIKRSMEEAAQLAVPLVADLKHGPNWNDMAVSTLEVYA